MEQMKKKLEGLLLFLALFMFAVPVMAGDLTEKKEIRTPAQGVEHTLTGTGVSSATHVLKYSYDLKHSDASTQMVGVASESYYLTEVSPKENEVITQGERLYVKFYARDTYKYYFTKPIVSVFDSDSNLVYSNFDQETVSVSRQDSYSGYISWDTSTAAPGNYYLYIVNAPCNSSGTLADNWTTFDCPYIQTGFILKGSASVHSHTYGSWKTVKAATVLTSGKKERTCTSCGQKESQSIPKLKATIKLSATKKTVGKNKAYTLKVTKLAKGDAIKSVRSSNKKIAAVKKVKTNQYKITGKKKGAATITVVLKSGKKATCKVNVK